jgi:hypothetical protein
MGTTKPDPDVIILTGDLERRARDADDALHDALRRLGQAELSLRRISEEASQAAERASETDGDGDLERLGDRVLDRSRALLALAAAEREAISARKSLEIVTSHILHEAGLAADGWRLDIGWRGGAPSLRRR